jgi:hypothetical protein|tara:strand:- start:942 stop:1202 length:261 start_codon:yes stop_codon:yes gene_type:complete
MDRKMATLHKFEYKGKKYDVPSFVDVPMGVLRKSRKGKDELDTVFIILETMIGEDAKAFEALDQMTGTEFGAWITAWTQGAGLGEA